MTHKDTTMLEKLNRVCAEELLKAGAIVCNVDPVRAILNELKTPSPGMIAAARKKYFAPTHVNGLDGVIADILTASIDHVLNEGEGNTTS